MKFFNKDLEEDVKSISKTSTLQKVDNQNSALILVNTGSSTTSKFYIYENRVERNIDYKLLRQLVKLKQGEVT